MVTFTWIFEIDPGISTGCGIWVELGVDYPEPMIDVEARYDELRG